MKQTTNLYCNNILGLFGWWLEGFSSPLSVCDWTVPYTCICSQIKLILSDEGYTVYKVIAMSTFITKTPECGLLFEKKKKIAHKYKCLCVITVCKAELYRKNKMVWSRKLRINHPLSLHSSSTIYPPFPPVFPYLHLPLCSTCNDRFLLLAQAQLGIITECKLSACV